jgi:hypothetical protein
MMIQKYIKTMAASVFIASSMHAAGIDTFNSLIAAPALHDTIVVSGPLVIGIVTDFAGKPVKNSAVAVYVNQSKKVATVQTNKYGVWSYIFKSDTQGLQNGAHLVQAYVTLASGTMAWTQASLFYVDASRQPMSTRLGIVNVANSAINFPSQGAYINTSTPTIVGSLCDSNYNPVVGETVQISINSVNIASVTSDSNGVFSYQVSSSLNDGNYTVGAHCVQSDVNLATNDFTIDTTPPAAPTITFPSEYEVVDSSTVVLTGTTEPNASITTFMDGDTFGEICYADAYGNWSIEYDGLSNGSHVVTAQATDLAENTGPMSAATYFTVSA